MGKETNQAHLRRFLLPAYNRQYRVKLFPVCQVSSPAAMIRVGSICFLTFSVGALEYQQRYNLCT
jgi:hypothetical protein